MTTMIVMTGDGDAVKESAGWVGRGVAGRPRDDWVEDVKEEGE